MPDQKHLVGWFAFVPQIFAGIETMIARAAGHHLADLLLQPGEEGMCQDNPFKPVHGVPPDCF